MYLDIQIHPYSDRCDTCLEWGRTITQVENPHAIACPGCRRLTWPNLGVNLPAGCAVSLGGGSSNLPLTLLRGASL